MNRFILAALSLLLSLHSFATPDCATATAVDWMSYSDSLISLKDYDFTNTHPRLRRIEEGVARNALITKAYAGLYRSEKIKQGEDKLSPYLWLPAGAFASFEVGQMMRHGYLRLKRKLGAYGTLEPKTYWENPLKEIFFIGNRSLTAEQVAINLAEGNLGVYTDLYWQHLSTAQCGVKNTIRILNDHKKKVTFSDREHYALLEEGWRIIDSGMESMDFDLFLKGNMKLLYVEQKLVLQKQVYDGLLGQLGGTLFAQLAENPVRDEYLQTDTFLQYCAWHLKLPNFSNFNTRWAWLGEQMESMYEFFNGPHADRVRMKHELFISDSDELLFRTQILAAAGE